jgi:hypothetical protein
MSVPGSACVRLRSGSVATTPRIADRSRSRPSVSTIGVNECVAADTRTCDPRSAAARTSAATSSSSRGAAAYAGAKDWFPTQFVQVVAAGRSVRVIWAMQATLQPAPPPRDLEEPVGRSLERRHGARLVGAVRLAGVARAADDRRREARQGPWGGSRLERVCLASA